MKHENDQDLASESERLIGAAVAVRKNAYAPYSGYRVGAAVLAGDGTIWTGCNVENISYGLSVCAERTAVCKMVSEGRLEIKMVAVSTKDGGTPCGMCLQTLLEFGPDAKDLSVITISDSGQRNSYALIDLIPHGFTSRDLKRT